VTIRDTGAGIPEEYLKRIFEPFFTTKSKGTGLGLAVCREIVELHRGEISLRSEVGHGTEFTVVLPREQQLEPERPGNGEEEAVNPI
jgi:two-component system NtrC family sensor kinase